jgi:hypothetical protein
LVGRRPVGARVFALVSLSVLGLGSISASDPGRHPTSVLLTMAVGGNGIGDGATTENAPYTYGGMAFCIDRPGRVTIDAVEPFKPTVGLAVQDFVFVPNPFTAGADTFDGARASIRALSGHGLKDHLDVPANPRIITVVCPHHDSELTVPGAGTDMLYVQFARTTNDSAYDQGLIVDYTSNGQHVRALFDWFVELCAKGKPCPCPPAQC